MPGSAPDASAPLIIHDYASGKTETVPSGDGRVWVGPFSPTQALATEKRADGQLTLHLIGRESEARRDVVVKTTVQVRPWSGSTVVSPGVSDDKGAVIIYADGTGAPRLGLVDYGTATMRPLPLPDGVSPFDMDWPTLGPTRILLSWVDGKRRLLSRADLKPLPAVSLEGTRGGSFLGDWLITEGRAVPVKGGATRTVLPAAESRVVTGSDGTVYVNGGSDAAHWGVQRISLDAQGVPRATKVLDIPPNPVGRHGLAFSQGRLAVYQNEGYETSLQVFNASVSGPVSVSQKADWKCLDSPSPQPDCAGQGFATGDGRIVAFDPRSDYSRLLIRDARPSGTTREVNLSGATLNGRRIVAASGRYLLFEAYEKVAEWRFYVADIDTGRILPNPAPGPAVALWGSTLWQPEGDKGIVAGTDLRTGKVTRRVNLGSGCRPYELQATAEWFYSTCSEDGDAPAAYHVPTKKRVSLPAAPVGTDAQLGDGFVVREHGELYNLRSGKAVREFAPAQPVYGNNALAVDRFGGGFAYVDPVQTVHVVGVTGKASPLTAIDRNIPNSGAWSLSPKRWAPKVWLSKPARSWTLVVTSKATGKVVRTRTGGEVRGLLEPMKDGRESSSGFVLPDGAYTWALKAGPADGQGAELALSGPLTVTGGSVLGGP
ncbi:hypothetical protein [Streptomyces sp. NPDC058401]|uniref:hypothetical protein n=1 Tax=Streptomyces sp. NPDC058401 TaxID=3346480 RepID=UPI0036691261